MGTGETVATIDALPLDELDVIGPDIYARDGAPYEAWRRLRREAPIHWFDLPGGVGFWAVTRHADIISISKQPKRFINGPRLAIFERGAPVEGTRTFVRQLLNMDPPEHGTYRRAASAWFTPRAIQRRRPEIERIAGDLLDGIAGAGELRECDFVAKVAAPLTLSVLADMLGVPREDWDQLFHWTNQVAGASDPEFTTGDGPSEESLEAPRNELFGYFAKLAEQRRAAPRDDIVSVLVNTQINGKPMQPLELLSYFFLLVIAGNETTRNAASGGLLALIENPGELARLKSSPELIDSTVEEIVRVTSPVNQFCRTAVEDVEMHGRKIRAGEAFCLFYGSANRDERVFDEPDRFKIDRAPNPHLGFGIGEHFCLGAHLARLELNVIFSQLAERLDQIELAGPVDRMRASFLCGAKRLPIRYALKPR